MRSGIQIFLFVAAVVLTVTAAAKGWTIVQRGDLTPIRDPVLHFLTVREVSLLAVVMELTAAGFIAFGKSVSSKLVPLACLCSVLWSYRLSYFLFGIDLPCGCLGVLGDLLKISANASNLASALLLGGLSIGSYVALWKQDPGGNLGEFRGDRRIYPEAADMNVKQ